MKTIAVYPGSFDPVTNGHVDIIERGATAFSKVVVAVLHNREKVPLFSIDERVSFLQKATAHINNVTVESFNGLLVDYVRKKEGTVIIRGLRAVSDFEYEMRAASMNKKLGPEIETFFMMTNNNYSYVSSSLVKEIAKYKADVTDLVPQCVAHALSKKFSKDE